MIARLAVAAGCVIVAAGCADDAPTRSAEPLTVTDSARHVGFAVDFNLATDGALQGTVVADSAFFLDEFDRAELRGVRATFYDDSGAVAATLTAREGTFRRSSNTLETRGDVLLQSLDGVRRLTTAELRLDIRGRVMATDSAFTLNQGSEQGRGVGLRTDPVLARWQCLDSCKGVLVRR